MKKSIIFVLILFAACFFSAVIFATGPSFVTAVIQPISVNTDGVILCKTRFEDNCLGALRIMPIQYGWAVIFRDGKIEEYPSYYFDADSYTDEKLLGEHYRSLQKEFEQEVDWRNPPESLLPIIEEYKFEANNVEKYYINRKMDYRSFLQEFNLSATSSIQRTLQGRYSIEYGDTVHILYIINNIAFLHNSVDQKNENYNNPVGARFNFYVEYQDELISYETFDITGVINICQ